MIGRSESNGDSNLGVKLDSKKKLNIMITCIGRRVSLLRAFRRAGASFGVGIKIFGTDTTNFSPAMQLSDESILVRPIKHRDYIADLLEVVVKNKIELLVPTVDLDLKKLAVIWRKRLIF